MDMIQPASESKLASMNDRTRKKQGNIRRRTASLLNIDTGVQMLSKDWI